MDLSSLSKQEQQTMFEQFTMWMAAAGRQDHDEERAHAETPSPGEPASSPEQPLSPVVPAARKDSSQDDPDDKHPDNDDKHADDKHPDDKDTDVDASARQDIEETSSSAGFTVDDFFNKEPKNPARRKLHYVIRKACKETLVWGKKDFRGVPHAKKCYIFDRVVKGTLPEMRLYESQVDDEMKRMLVNAKQYQKHKSPIKKTSPKKNSPIKNLRTSPRQLKKKATENGNKKIGSKTSGGGVKRQILADSRKLTKAKQTPPGSGESHSAGRATTAIQSESAYVKRVTASRLTSSRVRTLLKSFDFDSDPAYVPGDSVKVLHEGKEIAEAIFLEQLNDIFAELSFIKTTEAYSEDDEINLYTPVPPNNTLGRIEKKMFHELEADDFFQWKTEKLSGKRDHGSAAGRSLRADHERKRVDYYAASNLH